MPTRPCICPISARPNGRSNSSPRWRAGPVEGPRAARVLVQTFNPDHTGDSGGRAARFCRLRGLRITPSRDVPIPSVRRHDPAGDSRPGGNGRLAVRRATGRATDGGPDGSRGGGPAFGAGAGPFCSPCGACFASRSRFRVPTGTSFARPFVRPTAEAPSFGRGPMDR